MIIWSQSHTNQVWLEENRVGGNTLDFLGSSCSSDGQMIIGHSFNGTLHFWQHSNQFWEPKTSLGAHFKSVTDLSWSPDGMDYLLTCSLDETTRLHAINHHHEQWQEIARPQIHGYLINCLASLSPLHFVSGADEKVIRLFEASKNFLRSFQTLCNVQFQQSGGGRLTDSASLAPLGLSNKANAGKEGGETPVLQSPTEEDLLQKTLWPEIYKGYGHVHPIFSIAGNSKGDLIASASKATNKEDACIILWKVMGEECILHQKLCHHTLTVTGLKFSPNDSHLVSISRDRTWCLFSYSRETQQWIKMAFSQKKTAIHSRVLWDVSWFPAGDAFITSARDGQVIVWKIKGENVSQSNLGPVQAEEDDILQMNDSVTSVDVLQEVSMNYSLIAIGKEDGNVLLFAWYDDHGWEKLIEIHKCHHLPVKKVRFSPKSKYLATCGDDCIVKVFKVNCI